jgi:type IV pilus assembly protein PilQ
MDVMGEMKTRCGSWRKIGAISIGLVILALLPACAAKKDGAIGGNTGPARVTAVKAETGDKQDLISITTDPANTPYSVYKWSTPDRVVIDIPDATVAGVPSTIPVADGYISEIEVKEVKAEGSNATTVRVIVNLKMTMEYAAERQDSGLLVLALDDKAKVAGNDLFADDSTLVTVEGGTAGGSEAWAWGGPAGQTTAPAAAAPAPAPVSAGRGKNIREISVSSEGDLARVKILMDGGVGDYSAFVLRQPDRLVVDIWGLKMPKGLEQRSINQQGVQKVRVGQHPDKVRLVFDANGKLPYFRFDKSGDQLVVTFSRTVNVSAAPDAATAATAAAGAATSAGPAPAPAGTDWPVLQLAEGGTGEWAGPQSGATAPAPAPEAPAPAAPAAMPFSSTPPLDWGPTPTMPEAASGRVGIAYIDSVKFDYSNDSSSIIIHADRPIRRDQWTRNDNPEENIVSIFISGVQVAADQQRSYDTTEFQSPVELFSVFQRPSQPNEVAIVIVMRNEAASKWSQYDSKLIFQFENSPGSLGLAGAPDSGMFGPGGESVTGGAAAPGGQAGPQAPGATMTQYTGAAISLDFKNMDILDALRTIAEVSGVNMVVSDDVKGKITIKLENVPWDQALDLILDTKGLGKVETGNIMRIAPKEVLAREKAERLAMIEAESKYEELTTKIIPVNYLKAEDLRKILVPMVTPGRGKVDSYKRANAIIVRDIPKVVNDIDAMIRRLDRPTKQVLIEARIVEATVGITTEIGVQWGANGNVGPGTGTPTGLNFPNSVQIGGASLGGPGVANVNAPSASSGGGAIGLTVGSLNNAIDLDVLLRALEAQEKIKIISSPRIVTISDERATIQQGVSIPYPPPSYTAGNAGWTFVQASLELEVTPHVAADNSIIMDVRAANNEPVSIAGSSTPGISRKEAETTILLKDGETAVIGGIFKIRKSTPQVQVPFLGNLPYVGFLFRDRISESRNEELIIFLTPQIINPGSSIGDSLAVGGGGM